MLRPLEKEAGLGLVRTWWKSQSNCSREAGEFRSISSVLEHAFYATVERDPIEMCRARNAAEGQNEAVGYGRAEQRFR